MQTDISNMVVLLILPILALVPSNSAEGNGEDGKYRTAYACEGRQLRIECQSKNMIIHLLRANYGRFSISICNEHGNLDWSVDCTSQASFYVIKETCGNQNNCSLSASPTLFGDPCPGTPKYLEAHYQCVPEKSSGLPLTSTTASTSSSTSTSRPPIIIPVTRNVRPYLTPTSSDVVRTTSTTSLSRTSADDTTEQTTTTVLPPTTVQVDIVNTMEEDLFISGLLESSTSEPSTIHLSRWGPVNGNEIEVDLTQGSWCTPIQSKGMYWNWTRAGHVAVHRCPGGGMGQAKWKCDLLTAQWASDYPDLSDCTSLWVHNIKYRISRGDPVTSLAADLASFTRTKLLLAGDIVHTTNILDRLVSEMAERNREVEDPQHRKRLLEALLESVLEVSSNLLEDRQRLPWEELNSEQQQKSASALLRSQEKSGWLLAESHHSKYSFRSGQPHVLAAVHITESWDISDLVLPPPLDTTWWRVDDSLLVPAPSLLASVKQGVSRLVLLVHKRLGDLLGTDVHQSAMSQDTNTTKLVNSIVIGALLESRQVPSLPRPITVTLKHLQVENVTDPWCVFWDYQIGSWSTEGCWLKHTNRTHTVCQCSHLTNLALIMQISEAQDQPLSVDHLTLRMLVYIGCAVAMVFLLVTILILQFVRCLRTERVSIHKHLCLCLLLAEAALVSGFGQTEEPRACSVLAGLLHYLLLAAFAWAFLDSFHLYILLGDSDLHQDRWRVRWYSLVAYGIPLVVVAVSALVDPASYGTDTYCWLRVDNYYVFSFGGPAIACALASVLFLCLTVGKVCAQRNSTIPIKNKDKSKLSAVSKWSAEATVLLLILSSTWTLLPLFLHRERPLTAYFFLGLNSLQGLLVFLFYCISSDKMSGVDEPPNHMWLCACLRPHNRRRTSHNLYSPTSTSCAPHNVGTPLSPNHHHHLHLNHHIPNHTPPTTVLFPDRRSGSDGSEEHPLQYLLRPTEAHWRIVGDQRALCCYRAPRTASQQIQEPHYETLEPQEDPGDDLQGPRPLFSSLAAVLGVGGGGLGGASPCHVAYSGIQSPTDSDRSSSIEAHRVVASTPSSTGNDVTDSLPDLDRRTCHVVGIPTSLTY